MSDQDASHRNVEFDADLRYSEGAAALGYPARAPCSARTQP